jgi:hypothetical protein
MKTLSLVLLLALSMPACSMFSSRDRQQERAYSKYLKKRGALRQHQRSRIIQQRAEPPPLRTQPTPGPAQERVQTSEGQ